jgi:hypothetical protein
MAVVKRLARGARANLADQTYTPPVSLDRAGKG